MADVRLTRAAASDLEEIYLYTFRTFGEAAAERYRKVITERLEGLAEWPEAGHAIEGIAGYLRANAGRHAIIYRLGDETITVVRVLHDRRDIRALIQREES